ncbi:MAG TPA: class I SAM-dependent methyltransferase [Anaeromyxobacteraceae bacterium]|nr:class I SAM-dependent methyltransferase [Anaeromyxobacteraceae bacterium]
MYASYLGDFYNIVAAFQAEVEALERQIQLEKRDPPSYRDQFGLSVDALMVAARDIESHLAGAQDLIRDTQTTFRRLVSGFFCRSRFIERALTKPRGYAGDHAMMDLLYLQQKAPEGIERVLDDYALDLPAVKAAVDRKDYVKAWLSARLSGRPEALIADIACGPCRLERELFESGSGPRARWVALDNDAEALNYARRVLGPHGERFEFVQENAVRLARSREPPPYMSGSDYVISLGLFDYLPRNIALGLLRTLRASVRDGGELLVGNYADANPSQTFMEWVGDWPLIYRSRHDFAELFLEAGFDNRDLVVDREAKNGHVIMVTARVVK